MRLVRSCIILLLGDRAPYYISSVRTLLVCVVPFEPCWRRLQVAAHPRGCLGATLSSYDLREASHSSVHHTMLGGHGRSAVVKGHRLAPNGTGVNLQRTCSVAA